MSFRKFSLIFNVLFSTFLFALGIFLFVARGQKLPQQPQDLDFAPPATKAHQNIISGQYLILLDENLVLHLDEILEPLDLEPVLPLLNWVLVAKKNSEPRIIALDSPSADLDQLRLSSLQEHPYVLDAHHNFVLETAILPDNPKFSHQWHLQPREGEPFSLNMPLAWAQSEGSAKVSVAIVDDFLYKNSFLFAQRFRPCMSRVELLEPFTMQEEEQIQVPHGEYMLLALGACNNQPRFSAGMDAKAKLMAVSRPSRGHAQTMAAALYASGINVCTESLIPCPDKVSAEAPAVKADILLLPFANNAPELLQFFASMMEAINEKNIIVVASAGNNKENANNFFPGQVPGLINVGALNEHGRRSKFSNWGTSVNFLAPGEAIQFAYPAFQKTVSGTSLSAAFAAGSISLMKALHPELSTKMAQYYLSSSAKPLSCENYCLSKENEGEKLDCVNLCCTTPKICGALALDTGAALQSLKKPVATGLLELDRSYLVFTRNKDDDQEIELRNVGDEPVLVEARIYDDNIRIFPMNFSLAKKGVVGDRQKIRVGFIKEPFRRQTASMEFVTKDNSFNDKAELFIEYIPKKSVGKKKPD